MSADIRPLICIPSPRDIEAVKKNLDTIKDVPKLWVKYFPERDAYKIIQGYFLDHPEYQYLIISPDDLIVRNQDYQELIKTIVDHGGPANIPTLAGICNVHNVESYRTQMAICIDMEVHPQRRRRHWIWSDLRHPSWREKGYDNMRLLKVKFSGFGFQFIRRDVLEEIGLHGDKEFNELHKEQQDYSYDIIFCYLCNQHKPEPIPLYVNPQVKLLHLRGSHPSEVPGIENIRVGKEPGKVLFVDEKGKQKDITKQCAKYIPSQSKQEDPLAPKTT